MAAIRPALQLRAGTAGSSSSTHRSCKCRAVQAPERISAAVSAGLSFALAACLVARWVLSCYGVGNGSAWIA